MDKYTLKSDSSLQNVQHQANTAMDLHLTLDGNYKGVTMVTHNCTQQQLRESDPMTDRQPSLPWRRRHTE